MWEESIDMKDKQIVIFGGSFNPPLNSHFSLAEQILNEYSQVEKIIFVPVNSSYQKLDLIHNEHRYQMLKLVCDKNEKLEVSRMEIDNTRQLYTIETLRKFKALYPAYEIAFIMGSDNLKELPSWKEAQELVKSFPIYVLERARDKIEEIIQADDFLKENELSFIKAKNNITTNLSATFVRKKLKEHKSIRYLTPDEIVLYIKENNLYQ